MYIQIYARMHYVIYSDGCAIVIDRPDDHIGKLHGVERQTYSDMGDEKTEQHGAFVEKARRTNCHCW